ncbi:uncharacterized protein ARMOST_01523 [Armillaria ostoyae]|uniref:Uncharacterized protein n=1 Tax=Armillaria ostoyae TaxID=47428 RepID=A0A284QPD2_ARMOS|nr:uncharacterized protein ARMOST_01523 [Armillaria ostoyae]
MLFTFQRSFLRSFTNVYRTNLPELASGLHSDDSDVTIRADQRATGAPPDTITVDLQSFRHFYSLTSKRLGAPPFAPPANAVTLANFATQDFRGGGVKFSLLLDFFRCHYHACRPRHLP